MVGSLRGAVRASSGSLRIHKEDGGLGRRRSYDAEYYSAESKSNFFFFLYYANVGKEMGSK